MECRPSDSGESHYLSGAFTLKTADPFIPVLCYTGRRFPPLVLPAPESDDDGPDDSELYEVRIMDNDFNTYGEVMEIVMLTLNISAKEAFAVAWEVDHMGSCAVAHAPREEAETIASMIRTIGIEVRVDRLGP